MKKNNKAGLMSAAVIFVACLILAGCGDKKTGGPPPMPEVAIVTMQTKPLITKTELTGRTSANRIAEVRPQVSGIIQKRLFTEGSEVKSGQALFQIDPALYQAALARAEANLTALQLKAHRLRELLIDKAVSQQDYDDVAAALKQVQAEIQTARINLKYTTITAPISGRIGKSGITEGALVTAHQSLALATIQQLDPMYVDVTQSTSELLKLQRRMEQGQLQRNGSFQNKVRLVLEDNTVYPLEGTLKFRDVTVDPTTGSVILRIVFPNPQGTLLPGMFVRAMVQEGVNKSAFLVPQQAVSRDPKGNAYVLVVGPGEKVVQRPLILDRAIEDKWLVLSGIEAGERVIIEGMLKVKPGATVKAVPSENGGKNGGGIEKSTLPVKKINGGK